MNLRINFYRYGGEWLYAVWHDREFRFSEFLDGPAWSTRQQAEEILHRRYPTAELHHVTKVQQ